MKIRTGFVSNSSSASFTLVWRVNDEEREWTVEEAVQRLLEWNRDEIINEVKKCTTKGHSRNSFVSRFWTVMLNSESDIGQDAMALYFTLAMKEKQGLYEIVNADLVED